MVYDEEKHISIKKWSVEDRPREKLVINGANTLSNSELIAIILGSGSRHESAVELSRRILTHFDGSLRKIESASIQDLMAIKGIGLASATRIKSVFLIGRRSRSEDVGKKCKITSSAKAWEMIQPVFGGLDHEQFWVSLLNQGNIVIKNIMISKGGITATSVDPKLIYSLAIEHKASGIIMYHNHPSGNIQPSEADKRLTKKVCDIAAIMNTQILDHIIIGDENYFSFADHGLL